MAATTVIIPCYNEAKRLNLRAFIQHAVYHDDSFLFVNDGSTDGTGELLEDLRNAQPESFSVLHLAQNQGKAEAVRQGVLWALERPCRYVAYWDADLATPLESLSDFRAYLQTHSDVDMLMGARVRLLGRAVERRALRHLLGRLFGTVTSCVLHVPVYDTQCGAKMFRVTERTRAIFAEAFRTRWIFDVELLARYLNGDAAPGEPPVWQRIHELPLPVWRDVAGSKLRVWDFLQAAWQLASIYWHYRPDRPSPSPTSTSCQPRPGATQRLVAREAKQPVHELTDVL